MSVCNNRISRPLTRTLAAILAACLLVLGLGMPTYAAGSGSCGDSAEWSLSDGKLTISGSGAMTNFSEETMAPWYESRDEIISVSIGSDITHIGELSFYGCAFIESVSVPSSVLSIGDMAFAGCTGLERVKLSSGLNSIGDHAFSRCESLVSITLPDRLLHIGDQAFYRCSSLTSVKTPTSVSNFGDSVFAYCTSLVRAEIGSYMTTLPRWTFYGCTSLVDVVLQQTVTEFGEYAFEDCESLSDPSYKELISSPSDQSEIVSSKNETVTEKEDGTVIKKETEVVDMPQTNVTAEQQSTTAPSGDTNRDTTIRVDIDEEEDWENLMDYTEGFVSSADRSGSDGPINKVDMNINLSGSSNISGAVLQNLAGSRVNLNLNLDNDVSISIDCETLDGTKLAKTYDMSYTLTRNENPTEAQKALIGSAESFLIEFAEDLPFDVTVKARLGIPYARHYASFCEEQKDWRVLQSVLVEDYGYASFYLNSVEGGRNYLIAIDVSNVVASDVLIPDSIADEYGGLIDEYGTKYVVTGRTSSWGMSGLQVGLTLAAVMIGSILIIGVIMAVISRRKYAKLDAEYYAQQDMIEK